jgi:hypothetical protein
LKSCGKSGLRLSTFVDNIKPKMVGTAHTE